MGVSRVDFGGETLVDLTQDTVTPQSLLSGYSAHNKAGELIEGLVVIPTKVSELKNDSKFITETGDSSKTTVTFEQATERANVQSGDDLETAFAKLSKYCADLKQVAFSGKYIDLEGRITLTNNLLATSPRNSPGRSAGKNIKRRIQLSEHTEKIQYARGWHSQWNRLGHHTGEGRLQLPKWNNYGNPAE